MPTVTIVTAVLNLVKNGRVDYFKQCLESVHNQTYKNIEHIIIDGASSDGTLDIIQEYIDKGWVKCFSEKDTGIYNAFNNGIKHATGKYVVFLNSDDYYCDERAVELSINALEKTGADFSCATANVIDSEGKTIYVFRPNVKGFALSIPFPHETMFCRTDTIRRYGGFDESFRIAGDYDLILKMILSGCRVVVVDATILDFRATGVSFNDMEKAKKECIRSQISNLGITEKQAVKIQNSRYFPVRKLLTVFKNIKISKTKQITYHMLENIHAMRSWIIKFHTNRNGITEVKLFGFYIVKK